MELTVINQVQLENRTARGYIERGLCKELAYVIGLAGQV